MAMAPTHTTRDAVTKPSTNRESSLPAAFSRSQLPSRSSFSSKSKNSPTMVPMTMEAIITMLPPVVSPLPSTVNIPASAPEAPMNMVHRPMAFCSAS